MSIEADLPNLGLDSMCSWTCCSQDLNFNGATAVNHRQNHPWKCVKMNSLRICQSSYPRILLFFHRLQSRVPSVPFSHPSCCAKNWGNGLYSCNRSVTPLSQGGIGSWKKPCPFQLQPAHGAHGWWDDDRRTGEFTNSVFIGTINVWISCFYTCIFAKISRFIWSFCFIFGAVRSSQLCCCYLVDVFFPQLFPGQPATSSAARGAGAAPICERNQRLNTTCVGGSHWSNSKNMWSVPYVGSFLGQGWSGSEWDVHQWFHLRMKSCPSIHLKAGMGLPDFQTSNEATGVEAVSRFSAGFGIYDNSIWMRTPILSVPSSCIEPRFAR